MKKIISTLLALVMALSLTTVAFAAAKQDQPNSFSKKYTVTNGTAPAETFNFKADFDSYKNNEGETDKNMTAAKAPTVNVGTVNFAASDATSTNGVSVSIGSVENAPLGFYTYKITEVAPTTKTAGVTYNSDPVYLVLTVLRDEDSHKHYVAAIHYEKADGDKVGEIENFYNAGNLTVTKQIEGNMADMDKEFTFTITLTAPDGTAFDADVQNDIDNADAAAVYNDAKTSVAITVPLGDGESINITNIPDGTTYTVSENAEGYTSTHTVVADGSIAGGDTDQDTWTNTKTSEVDTGINMDSLPYILLLAVACVGMLVFFTKKRSMREN